MDPFPERDELISLFECEPVLMDPDLSWRFNTMDVRYRRGEDSVDATIEASYREITFRWTAAGVERAYLVVKDIAGLSVEIDRGREALVAVFPAGDRRGRLRIQLKPHIHILWGDV
jgi:hypothetical protein